MPSGRKARDLELLDALDALERISFEGTVWRAVREGRDPVQGHASAGRWDPGIFAVLYTALEPDGARAEIHFHLSRQPVFPSTMRWRLWEIVVRTRKTLRLADMRALARLGVEEARYAEVLYARTQEIGDAAHFLGFDGVLAPNARWPCLNLTLFTDCFGPDDLRSGSSEPVDIAAWSERRSSRAARPGTTRRPS
jgi:RES domain-containing protein